MKKSKKGLAPVLVLLGIVLVATGVWYFGIQKGKSNLTFIKNPVSNQSNTSETNVDQVSYLDKQYKSDPNQGWETYYNTQYKYSIKYPQGLSPFCENVFRKEQSDSLIFDLENASSKYCSSYSPLTINHQANAKSLSAEEYYLQVRTDALVKYPDYAVELLYIPTKKDNLNINGVEALRYTIFGGMYGDSLHVLFVNRDVIIDIVYPYSNGTNPDRLYPGEEVYGEVYGKMVETFKFSN